jgi:hypothetical protein
MKEDKADLELLGLANEKRKFAIALDYKNIHLQEALERGIDNQWFTLVDVSVIAVTAKPVLMRVFRLTDAGLTRLAQLQKDLQ